LGRRRVDCLVFFRLSVVMQGETLPKKWAFQKEAKAFETAGSMLKKSGGSLFVRNPQFMEINIPSNIPVRFSEYEFNVLIFTERMDDLQSHIDNFFQKIMGGWKYRSYHYPFDGQLPADLQGVPCLVLLDSALVKVYVEMREENDRRKDGVVLFPEDEIDIDILDGSAILPENILFVPPASDEKHFHRCLAGVIFRRFLKEMVRDQANMGYRDIDILKRLAS
ncbi:MAG: hypothetical protein NTX25_08845, partial [Proteobacteria bacterium]|nr:hypothetical protein [Pseudomonadota bacterium]